MKPKQETSAYDRIKYKCEKRRREGIHDDGYEGLGERRSLFLISR